MGVAFGVAATLAIPDTFVKEIAIPVPTLLIYLVVSAFAGIVAAILPALRAGRMNVLDAISHE